MQIIHAKSNTLADKTGTVTFWDGTTTGSVAATNQIRPGDWNSAHNLSFALAGNTTVGSSTTATALPFRGTGGISLGISAGSLLFSGHAPNTIDGYIVPYLDREFLAAQIGNNQVFVQPLNVREAFQFDGLVMPIVYTATSNSSGSATLSVSAGIYTRTGNSLSLLSSTSGTFAVTNSGTVGSYSLVSGLRHIAFNWTGTLPPDNYWFAMGSRTTTGGAAGMTWSNVVASNINSAIAFWQAAANNSQQFVLGLGSFNTTTTALPGSFAFSAISGSGANNLRQVIFQFRSGTV
jgi:hypothetical protein